VSGEGKRRKSVPSAVVYLRRLGGATRI